MDKSKYTSYEDCIKFHGHLCGGITMGYILSVFAMQQLEALPNENLFCRVEFHSCMTDAVQCVTGCTIGKKNLEIKPADTKAMYLVRRATGEGVKVKMNFKAPEGMTKQEMPQYLMTLNPADICTVKKVKLEI